MSTDIPHARQLIYATLLALEAPHVGYESIDDCIADLKLALVKMTRTPVKGPRKRISAKMTPALALAIAADIRANPGEAHQVIGDRHGVLGARITEMITGQHDGSGRALFSALLW